MGININVRDRSIPFWFCFMAISLYNEEKRELFTPRHTSLQQGLVTTEWRETAERQRRERPELGND